MADLEHKDITDPNIHEPKGISSASSGDVYVANGSGSGAMTSRKTIAVKPVYGQIYFDGNATATTLTTQNTYYRIAGTYTNGQSNEMTLGSNQIEVDIAGVYEVTLNLSVYQNGGSTDQHKIAIAVNGTPQNPTMTKALSSSTDPESLDLTAVLSLSDGDVLYPMITNTSNNSKSAVVVSSIMSVELLRET